MKKVITTLLALAILAAGGLVMLALVKGAPLPEKKEQRVVVPTVTVIPAISGNHTMVLKAHGVVIPARQISLKSQVSGEVIELSEKLAQGAVFPKGETLMHIDPTDYRLAITQQEELVANAQYQLDLEMGRQTIATEEWNLFGDSVPNSPVGKSLALRKPHLAYAKASLEAAHSRLDKAKLNLARTHITAPFNGVVLNEQVETGQVISAGAQLATLVDRDTFLVKVSIPYQQLSQLQLPDHHGDGGSQALVRLPGQESGRPGQVTHMLSSLEEVGRMARVLVSVDNPLDSSEQLPLLLSAYVEVAIQGKTLRQVVPIPYGALRNTEAGDFVWLLSGQDTLEHREVRVGWRDQDTLYISSGLQPGDRIITSNLSVPLQGMKLSATDEMPIRSNREE